MRKRQAGASTGTDAGTGAGADTCTDAGDARKNVRRQAVRSVVPRQGLSSSSGVSQLVVERVEVEVEPAGVAAQDLVWLR